METKQIVHAFEITKWIYQTNTYKVCNTDVNKFILMLRSSVFPYDCMDD